MNTFQTIMLVGAAILGASLFWPQIQAFLAKSQTPSEPDPEPDPDDDDEKEGDDPIKIQPTTPKSKLVAIVARWELLKNDCDKSNLKQASDDLDAIFPLLIQVRTVKETQEEGTRDV